MPPFLKILGIATFNYTIFYVKCQKTCKNQKKVIKYKCRKKKKRFIGKTILKNLNKEI